MRNNKMKINFTKGFDGMTRIINSTIIYDGTTAKIVDVSGGEQAKIQGVGSGTYTLRGRLSSECAFDDIATIKASDFSKKTEVSDDMVYCADVSGYSQITVDADSFDKIYVTIIG